MPANMSVVIRLVALAAGLASVSGCANSQTVGSTSPSQPSEPHEALAFYEGTWTYLDGKPEEGFQEKCSWLAEGRRHMVCRARWKAADGPPGDTRRLQLRSSDRRVAVSRVCSKRNCRQGAGPAPSEGLALHDRRGAGAERVRTRESLEETVEGRVTAIHETAKGEGP